MKEVGGDRDRAGVAGVGELPADAVERRVDVAEVGEADQAALELTRRYLEILEEEIRRYPELWLWMHRRWDRGRRAGPS